MKNILNSSGKKETSNISGIKYTVPKRSAGHFGMLNTGYVKLLNQLNLEDKEKNKTNVNEGEERENIPPKNLNNKNNDLSGDTIIFPASTLSPSESITEEKVDNKDNELSATSKNINTNKNNVENTMIKLPIDDNCNPD